MSVQKLVDLEKMLKRGFFAQGRWYVPALPLLYLEAKKILIIFGGMMQLRAKFCIVAYAVNLSKHDNYIFCQLEF